MYSSYIGQTDHDLPVDRLGCLLCTLHLLLRSETLCKSRIIHTQLTHRADKSRSAVDDLDPISVQEP